MLIHHQDQGYHLKPHIWMIACRLIDLNSGAEHSITAFQTTAGIIDCRTTGRFGDHRPVRPTFPHIGHSVEGSSGWRGTPFRTKEPWADSDPSHHVIHSPSGSHFMGI